MKRWATLRVLGGVAILVLLGSRLGTGPFLRGIEAAGPRSVALATLVAAGTTLACAWRWRAVAAGLGAELSLPRAVASYYRSQFLNTVLPGGVVGDVHRGVDHGRAIGHVGGGLRAVAWERVAGQVVQVVAVGLVLVVLPSPVRPALPSLLAGAAALILALGLAVRFAPKRGGSRLARSWRLAASDLRRGVLSLSAWPAITIGSLVALTGHLAVFVIAADAVGVDLSLRVLIPLALIVLVAAALPVNVGGWGPREGVAAWAFAGTGAGADRGLATATAFGVLMFVATLPGAVVAVAGVIRRQGARRAPAPTIRRCVPLPMRFPDGFEATANAYTFHGLADGREHVAFGFGRIGERPLVRLHSECLTGDVFGSQRCDCGPQLREAVERIASVGGYLIYLRQEGRGIGLYEKLDAYELQDGGLDTYDANVALGREADERDYSVAAQMLHALQASRIALLTNNPDKGRQLARHGITIVEQVATAAHVSPANARYLATKVRRGAHTLDLPA